MEPTFQGRRGDTKHRWTNKWKSINNFSAVGRESRVMWLRWLGHGHWEKAADLMRRYLPKGVTSKLRQEDQEEVLFSRWSSGQSCGRAMRWEQAGRFKEHKSQSGESVLNKIKGFPGANSPVPQPPLKSVPHILGSLKWLRTVMTHICLFNSDSLQSQAESEASLIVPTAPATLDNTTCAGRFLATALSHP